MPQDDITIRTRILGAHAAASDSRKVGRSVSDIGKSAKETERHTRRMGRGFVYARGGTKHLKAGVVGLTGALGFGAGLGLIGAFKTAFDEATEATKATHQTQAVIKSTGGAANVTAKHVGDLSNAISEYAGIDDEVIQKGANMLLTFRNIRNEVGKGNKIFDKANRTLTDMSVATGQDNVKSAIQLGKALNDPIKGMTALQRVGVTFDDQQKKQVASMVAHNNLLGAQKIILKELNKEFAGSARKQATPMEKLNVTLHNLAETVGLKLLPYINKGARAISKFVIQMQNGKGAGGRFVTTLKNIWEGAKPVIFWFGRAIGKVAQFAAAHPKLVAVATAIGIITKAVRVMSLAFATTPIGAVVTAMGLLIGVTIKYRHQLHATFVNMGKWIKGAFTNALNWVIDKINAVIRAYNAIPLAPNIGEIGKVGQDKPVTNFPGIPSGPHNSPSFGARDGPHGSVIPRGFLGQPRFGGSGPSRIPPGRRGPGYAPWNHKLMAPPAALGTGGAGVRITDLPPIHVFLDGRESTRSSARWVRDDRNRR